MRKQTALSTLALLTIASIPSQVSAVQLNVQPVIRSVQNLDLTQFDPSQITLYDPAGYIGVAAGAPPMILTVDYYMSISQLAGAPFEVGFGNVVFDLLPENLTIAEGTTGWRPDSTLIEVDGEPTAIWSDNGDFGPSNTDLASIIAGIAPGAFGPPGTDPRRTLGQQTPTLLGTTRFQWDPAGEVGGELDVSVGAFSTYGSDLRLRRRASGVRTGGSLSMLVSEGQAGDTDKDGDVDLNDLNNVRNHYAETGVDLIGDTAPYDGVVDLDDLNRVREFFGESVTTSGAMTSVPEPSTFGLAACAVLAAMLWRQRRLDA